MFDADGNEMVDKREFMAVRLFLLLFILLIWVSECLKIQIFFHLAGRDIPQENEKKKERGGDPDSYSQLVRNTFLYFGRKQKHFTVLSCMSIFFGHILIRCVGIWK